MNYTTEELTSKVKDCLWKLLADSVQKYKESKDRAAYVAVDYTSTSGRILLVQWPRSQTVDVCWSPNEAGFADLGTIVGSVSTGHFGIETLAKLIVDIIQSFIEE